MSRYNFGSIGSRKGDPTLRDKTTPSAVAPFRGILTNRAKRVKVTLAKTDKNKRKEKERE